jgi:hypothetical protein
MLLPKVSSINDKGSRSEPVVQGLLPLHIPCMQLDRDTVLDRQLDTASQCVFCPKWNVPDYPKVTFILFQETTFLCQFSSNFRAHQEAGDRFLPHRATIERKLWGSKHDLQKISSLKGPQIWLSEV